MIAGSIDEFLGSNKTPNGTKEKASQLIHRSPSIVLIDMYDPKEGGEKAVRGISERLGRLTGSQVEVVPYTEVQKLLSQSEPSIITFSGKPTPFQHYIVEGTFEHKFGGLLEIIKDTDIPVLGLCAGHQLYAMAHGKGIHYISGNPDTEGGIRIVGWYDGQQILHPEHPLFQEFGGLRDRGVHYNHQETVDVPQVAAKLAENEAPNGVRIPNILEHKAPTKHALTFQFHPERDPRHQTDTQHYGGLVLLVSALDLLTNPKYVELKGQIYPRGT